MADSRLGVTIVAPENRPGNVHFQKIYNRAKDKDVAVVKLSVMGTTLCMDGNYALTAEEVNECCVKGCIVQTGDGCYRPVYWKVSDGVATVVFLNNNGSSGELAAKVFTSYQAS